MGCGRDLLTVRVLACVGNINAATHSISISCPTDNVFIFEVKPLDTPGCE